MTKFISNVNKYLSEMKIKQSYLSIGTDMEKIARGLGKSIGFFLKESMSISQVGSSSMNKIAFYAGEPSKKQEQIAKQLVELMENIDEVISANSRFENIARS